MSVNELQALTQKFADAFDQRDLQPVMEMLSEDVEVFDHVPYRFDGKPLFAKYLHEAAPKVHEAFKTWTENVRKSSADIRSIRRRTSGQCCVGWSNAPI